MKARKVTGLNPDGPLEKNLRRIVSVRLKELRSFAPAVGDPTAVQALHDMRIAAKRLRYVLEMGEPALGAAARRGAKEMRRIQDLLGEIHDCDEGVPRVLAHVERLRAEDSAAMAGLAGRGAKDLRIPSGPPRRALRGVRPLLDPPGARSLRGSRRR